MGFVNGFRMTSHIIIMENNPHVWNHQPAYRYSYGHLSVISTYNPIYRMYNPIYNQL